MSDATITPTQDTPEPRTARLEGLARLRHDEVYHLTRLAEEALEAAERLVRTVHTEASAYVIDYDGSRGAAPVDPDEAAWRLGEALKCATLAEHYLRMVINDPPF